MCLKIRYSLSVPLKMYNYLDKSISILGGLEAKILTRANIWS